MTKQFRSAAMLGLALGLSAFSVSPVLAEVTAGQVTTQQEQTPLQIMQAAIEQIIIDNADDPVALQAAIEAYVAASDNPELAAQAVLAAVTDPQNPAAQAAMAANADLVAAVGRGLGAAIATIALTDPDAAAAMQASVDASGNESLAAAVSQGSADKTASIEQQATAAATAAARQHAGKFWQPELTGSGCPIWVVANLCNPRRELFERLTCIVNLNRGENDVR